MYDARIIYLFEKYKNKQSSVAEDRELLGYFTDPALENKLKVLLGDAFDRQSDENGLYDNSLNHLLANIYGRIPEQKADVSAKASHRNNIRYWIAAAVILLFLTLGGYHEWNRIEKDSLILGEQQMRSREAGWTNQLTLTLSSSKLLALDQMKLGEIIEDAGVRIHKSAEDEIWYEELDIHQRASVKTFHRLDVPYGRQMRIRLVDGSRVALNACSALTYYPATLSQGPRWAKLEGEAYFEIEKKAEPFTIEAKEGKIRVLGTKFNVLAYPDEPCMKTTLVDGKIRLNQTLLVPGEQAMLRKGKINLKKVDTDQVIAWTNGYLTLDNENIYSIMRKIARWYHVEVIYRGDLPLDNFGGAVKKFTRVEDLLDVLTELGGVHFQLLEPISAGKERRLIVVP